MSSSWRAGRTCAKHKSDFVELIEKLSEFGIEIEDYTPQLNARLDKSIEIEAYLTDHPEVENFVILDDDDVELFPDNHIQTLNRYGLTEENVNDAIEMLHREFELEREF